MTTTTLPSQADIGTLIKIKSCNGEPVRESNIQFPQEVFTTQVNDKGELIPGKWIVDDEGNTWRTYRMVKND